MTASEELIADLGSFAYDPVGFVWWAFPWDSSPELRNLQPDPWQLWVLESLGSGLISVETAIQIAVSSGHGIGKAQPVKTTIETPSGPKRFGDLKPGDYVFSADGNPTRIKATRRFSQRPVYKVTFSDGTSTEADENHLWAVRGRQQRRTGDYSFIHLTTKEILEKGVKRANGAAKARQWEIPKNGPVQYTTKNLPLDPYLLGAWLGDGTKKTAAITSADPEIFDHIAELGYTVSTYNRHTSNDHCETLTIKNIKPYLPKCTTYNAEIPKEYLRGDFHQRLELLRGLMDTDGWVEQSGTIMFGSVSHRLAKDVEFLARSLGMVTRWKGAKRTTHSDFYRVSITCPEDIIPFRLNRKIDALVTAEDRYLSRWIDSIERVSNQDTVCIEVEAKDGLYLTENFIVTHNSALVAWIVWWAFSTFPDTRGVVTANTENQLKTKTWVEIAKWHRLFIAKSLFKCTATALFSTDEDRAREWRIDIVPWSERNTEAFAGLHNQGKRILVMFDEASAIPDVIWETTEGALTDTDTEIVWCVFGNPTRNDGRFRECFDGGRFEHRWVHRQVDSREVAITNKEQISRWVEDYGLESDFIKVRVLGKFPTSDEESFISREAAEAAAARQLENPQTDQPIVLGVDVARYGGDSSVIYPRQGRDGRTLPPRVFSNLSTVQLAAAVVRIYNELGASTIFVDGGGVGGGVVDQLQQFGVNVIEVQFGGKPDGTNLVDPLNKYYNKRAEIWGAMRDWLKTGAIPDHVPGSERGLVSELISPHFTLNPLDKIQLESKEMMRRRGAASPDLADALACTFAYPVSDRPLPAISHMVEDYNPLSEENIYEKS